VTATGGDVAAATLAEAGVRAMFGLHGGHLDPLLLGCARAGIRLVDTRHEAAAVNAADGWARTTGEVGVAFATASAGFLNAVAGLGPAAADRSAVVLLTSSPPLRDAETNTLQGFVDQVAVAVPLVKWAHRVTVPEEIPRLLAHALRTAVTGVPGPVVLDLPIDVLFSPVDPARVAPSSTRLPARPQPDPGALDAALQVLRRARRPVIVAGGGLRGAVPSRPLVELADTTGVPVFHPGWIVGAMPPDHRANGWVARNLAPLVARGEGPDAVLLLGSRLGLYLGGRGGGVVPADATVIAVDADPAEPGRVRPVDLAIAADVGEAVRVMAEAARQIEWPDRSEWCRTATAAQRAHSPFADAPEEVGGRMHPFHALRAVLRSLDPGATLIVDGGEHSAWAAMSVHEAAPRRAIGCGYLGYLGTSPGLAIGAQVAEPDRRVVVLVGDGGAGFHLQEFDTMVRHGLPIVTVVVNNACCAMSLHGQQMLFGDEAGVVSGLGGATD
jgi:acetolactate synthase-1/2/3 large subunit